MLEYWLIDWIFYPHPRRQLHNRQHEAFYQVLDLQIFSKKPNEVEPVHKSELMLEVELKNESNG